MEAITEPVQSLTDGASDGPSIDFIQAISEFLDTDPTDLLVELGYHEATPIVEDRRDVIGAR